MIRPIRNFWRKCKGRTVNKTVVPYDRLFVGRGWPAGAAVLLVAIFALPAFGQGGPALAQTSIQQQREIEQQIRQQLGEYLPPSKTWQIDAGDWQSFYFFNFNDGTQRRTQRLWDNRAWLAGTGDWGTHQFYARLKMTYTDWNRGDSYDGNEDDFNGADADRLWYQFDLRQAAKIYGKMDLPFGLQTPRGPPIRRVRLGLRPVHAAGRGAVDRRGREGRGHQPDQQNHPGHG